jgi:hypothetical protein
MFTILSKIDYNLYLEMELCADWFINFHISMWTDFDSDIYNSANMVVYFDEKDDDLYLRLRAMSHTVYVDSQE